MTFLDIQTAITSMSLVTSQPTLVAQAIQFSLNRISQEDEWPYYMNSKGVITTVAPYSTGTVDRTNGSTAIVGHGTTWTSDMVGRKIQLQGDQAHYYILLVNSPTSITLSIPYQGVTATLVTYNIYKDEYKIASDCQSYGTWVQIQNSVPMVDIPPAKFDQRFPTQTSFDSPYLKILEGTSLDTYTTGTVSTTSSSNSITGVGTSWLSVEGLGRMTDIIIGSNRYTVKSVDSDTAITLFENANITISGSSYQFNFRNYKVQVFSIPSDVESLYYRYYRMPDILFNNYDVPDLPSDWHMIIVWGALTWIYLQKGDISKSYQEAEQNFIAGIKRMKTRIGNPSGDRIYRRGSQDRSSRVLDGREKGTFDVRYSGI